ncbi:MAG: hypothetical protein L0I76_27110 [Pseudonocardia sp.]|nr:hypothetical protein [Pseudonocardia sp.]
MSTTDVHPNPSRWVALAVLCAGMPMIILDGTIVSVALPSGLANTSQQVGGALGVAVLAALAAAHPDGLLAAGDALPAALAGGYRLAFLTGAVAVATAAVLTVTVLRPRSVPATLV